MKPSGDFRSLRRTGLSALTRLRLLAVDAALQSPAPHAKRTLAFVTIELLNTWNSFARSYVLSCVMCPRRANGGRVSIGLPIRNFNDAIAVAMKRHRPNAKRKPDGSWDRRDEPPWFDTNVLRTVCKDLLCSHHSEVENALSIPTRVFVDLPVFRNFVAHRNKGTVTAAKSLGTQYLIPTFLHPIEMLATAPGKRPHPLIVDWIDDVFATVELLTD